MKKCVVTGRAGFIGSHLTRRLLELGYKVTVIDDFSEGKRKNLLHILPEKVSKHPTKFPDGALPVNWLKN